MKINEYLKKLSKEKDLFNDIIGQDKAKKEILSALIMNRHIILVGAPGIGKTTLAKNIARLLPDIKIKGKTIKGEDRFVRIQGSPDLTVEDLLGDIDPIKALKYGAMDPKAFTPGKVFKANNGVLFFDEVNRAPERLQNALLQVLEERKATLGGYDIDLEANFIFIGSLHPDEEVLICTSKGFMKRVKIGKLVDNQIDKYGFRNVKGSDITDNFEDIYALSYNLKTDKVEKLPITSFIRHKPTDFIYEISLAKGRKVKVTGKHSVFDESLIPVKISDLNIGDKIAIPKKINYQPKNIDKINLMPFFASLDIEKEFFVKYGNISEIIDKNREILVNSNGSHIVANYKYSERMHLSEAIQFQNEFEEVYIGVNGSCNVIKSELIVDEDLCWLIGFFVAEGFTQKAINNKGTYRYNLWLSNKNLSYLEKARKIIIDKFGLQSHIKIDKRTDVYDLTVSSLPAYYVFNKLLEITKGSQNKRVSSLIFQLSKDKVKNFLKGYIEGDGNYYADKNGYKSVSFSTVSKDLANDLAYLFLKFGKIVSINKVFEKRKNHRNCYRMYLCNTQVDNILNMEEENESLSFQKVIEIKKLNIDPVYVYDLEVLNDRKTDNFIGGFGGVLLHNTMNPEDFTGTEKLSEVFLDRFDLVEVNYPENVEIELKIVRKKGNKLDNVEFDDKLLIKVIRFIQKLRTNENIERAPSVRATLGLYERAQSNALLNNRSKVVVKDVVEAIYSVLVHRIKLKPSVKYLVKPEQFIRKEVKELFGEENEGDYP